MDHIRVEDQDIARSHRHAIDRRQALHRHAFPPNPVLYEFCSGNNAFIASFINGDPATLFVDLDKWDPDGHEPIHVGII